MDDSIKEELIKNIELKYYEYLRSSRMITNVFKRRYITIPVQTSSNYYGLVGADAEKDYIEKDDLKILEFIADLSAMELERFEFDMVSERLTKAEEQNRIANEMHDNVAQRLFSISCATHLLANNYKKLNEEQMEEKLNSLEESSNAAMNELRSTIYKLSSKRSGTAYIDDIRKYLHNISDLNNVAIDFRFSGDEELLDIQRKNGIYRIISESTGNAIRHGQSTSIMIDLAIGDDETYLVVKDDGVGFYPSTENEGLGLRNMSRLVNSYRGEMDIISQIGAGTEIRIQIPNTKALK